jgi:hypothetical protein
VPTGRTPRAPGWNLPTEPGEDPTAVEAIIERLSADITTITEHLTG